MAKSTKQIEQDVFAWLDKYGASKEQYGELNQLPAIEQLMILSAANFIIQVQENLERSGKVDTGTLSKDISTGEVVNTGSGYELMVGYPKSSKGSKYYQFVNKGVKGTTSGKPDSPFSFKTDRVGGEMVNAIAKWYRRNASAGRRETQKTNLSQVQRKRKKLLKTIDANKRLKSLAYATAVSIKRKGLKKTGFFDKAIESSFGKEFVKSVAQIAGKNIGIIISSYGNNNK